MKKEAQIDWDLDDIGQKISLKALVTTTTFSKSLRNELIFLKISNQTYNHLLLETAYFCVYLLQKRFSSPLGEEKKVNINKAVSHYFNLVYPIEFSVKEQENDLKLYIEREYDSRLESYENYNGFDDRVLFVNFLCNSFNSVEDSRIKFIENAPLNRIKISIAFFLAGLWRNKEFLENHSKEIYLPRNTLQNYADIVTKYIAEIPETTIYQGNL